MALHLKQSHIASNLFRPIGAAAAAAAIEPQGEPQVGWLDEEDSSPWPNSPLDRLRELGDESFIHYQRQLNKLHDSHLRAWEKPNAPPSSWGPIFKALQMDEESRAQISLLMKHSPEGQSEACKIIAHLLRNRSSIRNTSSYVMSVVHVAGFELV